MHVQSILSDTIKSKSFGSWTLENALKKISKSQQGALVFITNNLDNLQIDSLMINNSQAKNNKIKYDYRTIGIGAQILNDIGVKDMILLSKPKIYHGINAFGLNVIKYVSK